MADYPTRDPDDEAAALDRGGAERLGRVEVQRIWLRRVAVGMAALVILAFGCLETFILMYVLNAPASDDGLFMAPAISPIAAVTVTVVFVLIGVFQGNRNADMRRLPLQTAARSIAGADS